MRRTMLAMAAAAVFSPALAQTQPAPGYARGCNSPDSTNPTAPVEGATTSKSRRNPAGLPISLVL